MANCQVISISIQVIDTILPPSAAANIPDFLADLGFYVPNVTIDEENKKITLNYLFIPGEDAPLSMRRILVPTIRTLDKNMSDDQINVLLLIAEKKILHENLKFYENLRRVAQAYTPNHGDECFFDMIDELIEIQTNKIRKYKFYDEVVN